jgi:hypothetical protein
MIGPATPLAARRETFTRVRQRWQDEARQKGWGVPVAEKSLEIET